MTLIVEANSRKKEKIDKLVEKLLNKGVKKKNMRRTNPSKVDFSLGIQEWSVQIKVSSSKKAEELKKFIIDMPTYISTSLYYSMRRGR